MTSNRLDLGCWNLVNLDNANKSKELQATVVYRKRALVSEILSLFIIVHARLSHLWIKCHCEILDTS
jgi:hypothetical protein